MPPKARVKRKASDKGDREDQTKKPRTEERDAATQEQEARKHQLYLEFKARIAALTMPDKNRVYVEQGRLADLRYADKEVTATIIAEYSKDKKEKGTASSTGTEAETQEGGEEGAEEGAQGNKAKPTAKAKSKPTAKGPKAGPKSRTIGQTNGGGKEAATNSRDQGEGTPAQGQKKERSSEKEDGVVELGELSEERLKYTMRDPKVVYSDDVRIIVEKQCLEELFPEVWKPDALASKFRVDTPVILPPKEEPGLDKNVLMKCSVYALDFFTVLPHKVTRNRLPLPLRYPENPEELPTHISYVKPQIVQVYIISWLRKMTDKLKEMEGTRKDKTPVGLSGLELDQRFKVSKAGTSTEKDETITDLPKIDIPDKIGDKINLYNAMQHLSIRHYFQRPLIESLCKDIYCYKLSEIDLELLEVTVGRFNSRAVAALDPILCCLAGSYGRRDPEDKNAVVEKLTPGSERKIRCSIVKKLYYPDVKMLSAPLPVLGHTIKHWSLGGLNPKTITELWGRHTGFPLDIGKQTENLKIKKRDTEGNEIGEEIDLVADHGYPYDTRNEDELPPEKGRITIEFPSFEYDILRLVRPLTNLPGHPASK